MNPAVFSFFDRTRGPIRLRVEILRIFPAEKATLTISLAAGFVGDLSFSVKLLDSLPSRGFCIRQPAPTSISRSAITVWLSAAVPFSPKASRDA